MISKEHQAEVDAEFQAEVEVMRRKLRGEPVPAPPDPGVVAVNDFIARVLANAAAAGPEAHAVVLRVLEVTCAEINDNGPYDTERAAHK